MEYTILREGKTYQEYKDFILAEVEAMNLEAGDESKLLAKRYTENDKWFADNQKSFDINTRIEALKDLRLAISFSGLDLKNPALVIKQILEEDDMDLLSSLESVMPQVDEFIQKEKDKSEAKDRYKIKKKELKDWVKTLDFNDIKAKDIETAVIYMMGMILDEQDNE